MRPYLTLFARLFLTSALLFAALTALMRLFVSGTGSDDLGHLLGQSALAGVLFGGAISLSMGTGQILATRTLSREALALSVRQVWELTLEAPPEHALEKAVQAVSALKSGRVLEVDPVTRRVVAHKGASWRSWGEAIDVSVREAAAGSVVRLSSRPRLSTTLVDWGSNLRNVTEICRALSPQSARPVHE